MVTTVQSHKTMDFRIEVMPIDELRPHEEGSRLYLELLRKELVKDGMLKYPIIADEKTCVILDGMHRWLALKSLGYTLIPVIFTDALLDSRIRVGRRRIHRYESDFTDEITVENVISAGLSGDLMKPRTTRHFFPFSKFQQINCPLDMLGKRSPQDVSNYLARMTERECEQAIRDWLSEVSEELEFLSKRREEVEKERAELLHRINCQNISPRIP